MGGFHLFEHSSEKGSDAQCTSQEDDLPLHPLVANDLTHDNYSFTMPTEAEIKDRGKSDSLARTFVLLQTSWFIMQCIARGIEHLPLTHLEIVTLAYVAMNFVIYIFWRNKPVNVNRPVRVFRKSEPRETQRLVTEPISEGRELGWEAIGKGLLTIFKFIIGIRDRDVNLSREDSVPMFWANSTDGNELVFADFIVLVVCVCFGAIHCIAWFFSFPTHTELLMWRISSITITAAPVYIPLMFFLAGLLGGCFDLQKSAYIVFYLAPVIGGILYILARAITLVLAFTSLRDLLPGAYETVHWTTFIPHV